MALADLIRGKSGSGKVATATTATVATESPEWQSSVARVATVANPNPSGSDPEATSREPQRFCRWLVRYPNGESVDIMCAPPETHEEILEAHPEAVEAEPFEPTSQRPDMPLRAEDDLRVRRWLDYIEETDPTIIAEVLHACEADAAARAYFLGRAGEAGPDDDRRTCRQCCNLSWSGLCLAAHRGELPATSRDHHPIADRLHRCVGYVPGDQDLDQRLGIERWLGLLRHE